MVHRGFHIKGESCGQSRDVVSSAGRSGVKVSTFGLGAWKTFGESVAGRETVNDILGAAFYPGVTFFDSADAYANGESERVIGKTLAGFPRHELVVFIQNLLPDEQ